VQVGFYFSAGWCPPCRAFSPQLSYFANGHASEFVVIFVSSDHTEEEMKTFVCPVPPAYQLAILLKY
jgi:nucleoredoxin